MSSSHLSILTRKSAKTLLLAGSSMAMLAMSQVAVAQDGDPDEIVVTGSRQVIQDSISLKRESTQIVDGLSADEIGDIPALSIGEALESITGVASHRENGGATEVSVRGLGPYLSSTVVNGRAATNGSGDRSVNFSQFPSELMDKLAVFKTQDASQIEGGVAGQIQLDTMKPLDYGKERLQAEIKGNMNPDQLKQNDTEAGDLGYRGTISYVNQYEVKGLGDIGISVGLQTSDISQPEAESRQTGPTSNSRPACLITDGLNQYTDNLNVAGGQFTGFTNTPGSDRGDDDCDDFNDRNGDSPSDIPAGSTEQLFEDQRGSDTEGADRDINPLTGDAIDAGTPIAFAPSQRHFRQNDTRDQRDAVFGTLQWQPNDRLDINADLQWSERLQSERRNDLTFNGGRRNDTSLNIGPGGTTTTLDSMVLTPQGGILRSITDGNIEVQGGDWQREETYLGYGLNVEYEVSDRLTISGDYGHSNTKRTEDAMEFRIQSDLSPVIEFDQRNKDVPTYTLYDGTFDVNEHDLYVDRLRVRIDNDVLRDNTIDSVRFDVDYEIGGNFFTTVEAGVRWSGQDYLELPGGADSGNPLSSDRGRFSFEIENDGELTINNREVLDDNNESTSAPAYAQQLALQNNLISIISSTNQACRTTYPEGNSFMSSLRNGDLITNVANDGTVISSTNSWATFDATCMATTAANALNALQGDINAYLMNPLANENTFGAGIYPPIRALTPSLSRVNTRSIDVDETTKAFYLMSGYETDMGDVSVSGNIGVRVVHTDVEAFGYRPEIIVSGSAGSFSLSEGALKRVSLSHDYTEILPSANAIFELSDDKVIRLGVFKALSRPDPADMGFGRVFSVDDTSIAASVETLINGVTTNGNPAMDPLTSWNFDAGFEWYPNEDSILAIGGYFKKFQGGFENVVVNETYSLNGADVTFPVSVQQVSDKKSELFGIEFTGSHRFSYLPSFLSGLGAKVSYNYVDSNFEFEDSRYGDSFTRDINGDLIQTGQGLIAPGGLPGLSKHTLSAQGYYQIGDADISIKYKYRDSYFQPFVSDGTRLRFIGDVGVWEARASYDLTDNWRISAEAINLFSEPKEQFAFVTDDRYEINDYGPRVFFGLRGRF